jgi:Flp pilus assembly protein TadG
MMMRARRKWMRFKKHDGGATAIEFAILALPFLLTIFAIVETALSFTAQQVMSNATDRIAREIRTGRLDPAIVSQGQFRARLCAEMSVMMPGGCPDLHVDVQQYAAYKDVPKTIPWAGEGQIDTSAFSYDPGGPGTINSMRVLYEWPVFTDMMKRYLSNLDSGKTLIFATATWRNEP